MCENNMLGYHGTNKDNAIAIMFTGVDEYSFWAKERKVAEEMGGPHVFMAELGEVCGGWLRDDVEEPDWQFLNRDRVMPCELTYFPPNQCLRDCII